MEIPTTEPPRIKGHYCQVSPEAMEKFLEGSVVGIFSCRWVDSLCGWATPRRTSATPRDVPCLRPWAYPDYTPGGTHPGKAIPSIFSGSAALKTIRSRMLNYGNYHGKYMTINTNSARSHRQLYDYDAFIRPPKYR